MNPSFNIKSNIDTAGAHLFVFAGGQSFSLAVLSPNHVFTNVCVYNFEPGTSDAERSLLLQKILSEDSIAAKFYNRTDIIWCTAQSIITPQSFFVREESDTMLNLIFGDALVYSVKHELILKHQFYNVYRINTAVEKVITQKFTGAVQWHQSSLLVNFATDAADFLYCNFTPGTVTVMLRKQNQLQAVQIFEYHTANDAAFHLLNVCRCYEVDAAATAVTASGMIDESSILYSELHKYFLRIDFLQLPGVFEYSDEIKAHPAHYFSHLFTTASCVL